MSFGFKRSSVAVVGLAALINLFASGPAWSYADAFPWKLVDGGPDQAARLKIVGVFEDEASCRRAGVLYSKRRSHCPSGQEFGYCHHYTYCFDMNQAANPW